MARFCTSCGTVLEGDGGFCTKCGAKATPSAPAASPRIPGAPPPPPARQGGSALKIFLIIVGVFAGLSVLGVGSCLYIGYLAKQKVEEVVKTDLAGEPGHSVTIKTPDGELRLGDRTDKPATASVGGVPPYPGSQPLEGGAELSFGGLAVLAGQEYETPDSPEQVVAFYKEKFASGLTIVESDGQFRLMLTDPAKEGVTTIDIQREEDRNRTKILIAHMGK